MHRRLSNTTTLFAIVMLLLTLAPQGAAVAQGQPFTVFADPGFSGGFCFSGTPESADIDASCDEQISSITLNDGWSVQLYRDKGQAGPTVCLSRSIANLNTGTFEDGSALDNTISSFTLFNTPYCGGPPVPAYPLEVYNEAGYAAPTANSWCYSVSAHTANIYGLCNDQVSSILLRAGWSIRVYQDANLRGPNACLPASDPNLSDNTFDSGEPMNDAVSSFQLYSELNCGLVEPPDLREYFGDGRDGDLTVRAGETFVPPLAIANVSAAGTAAAPSSSTGFAAGDRVLFHQSQGTGEVGRWELNQIENIISPTSWTLASPLAHTYNNTAGRAQVIRVPQYRNVRVEAAGTLKALDWNGSLGGILTLMVAGSLNVDGAISMSGGNGTTANSGNPVPGGQGGGYRGGSGDFAVADCQGGGGQGEGSLGVGVIAGAANGNGAGGGHYNGCGVGGAGGGGGNGTLGAKSTRGLANSGFGGGVAGSSDLSSLVFGGGGGGASHDPGQPGGTGGAGGGAILLFANTLVVTGTITANGGNGGNGVVGGGGGAGGSIFVRANDAALGAARISASGGAGGPSAGVGGFGRIRVEYCTSLSGASTPPASTQQFDCGPPAALSTLTPASAVANAGQVPIIISGANFKEPISASIGGVSLRSVSIETSSIAHAVVPVDQLSQGTYDLTVISDGVTMTIPAAFVVDPPAPVTHFRVMVYLACDTNDLEASCDYLFNQLELAMSYKPDLRIVAFWDGPTEGDSAYYLIQADQRPLQRASYVSEQTVFPIGEANTGAPNTLVTFASWAQSRYPGQYHMLSLVGHGGGWAPDLHPGQPIRFIRQSTPEIGGMLWDTGSSSTLATAPLAEALKWITQAYPIDVLYLDACLMGSVEVATELKDFARYLVVHENLTWAVHPYARYLRPISTAMAPRDLAIHMAQVSQAELPSTGHPAQVSVVDLDKIGTLATAVSDLGKQLSDALLLNHRNAIRAAAESTARVNNKDIDAMVIDGNDQAIDLDDFSTRLIDQPSLPQEVKNAAAQVKTALANAVVVNYAKSGQPWSGGQYWDLSRLRGLSIYFPLVDDWKRRFYGSGSLPRFDVGEWDEFIDNWFAKTPPEPPQDVCDDCPFTPSHITLAVDGPVTPKLGDLFYVSVMLANVATSDDLRGIQASLLSTAPQVIAPATNQPVRIGGLFPGDTYRQNVALGDGWSTIANLSGVKLTGVSGSGVVASFPFYALGAGCSLLHITSQGLVNGQVPAQRLPHHLVSKNICVDSTGSTAVRGAVYLEGRGANTQGGAVMTLSAQNGAVYTSLSGPDGSYSFGQVPAGTYTLQFKHRLYLTLERSITIGANQGTTLGTTGLWGGDLEQSARIGNRDWRICAASVRIGDLTFDLDANGWMDVGDCMIVARNSGRTSWQRTSPPLPGSAGLLGPDVESGLAAPYRLAATQSADTLQVLPQGDDTLLIRTVGQNLPFYAVGVRLSLPAGAAPLAVQAQGSFAGQFLHSSQSGSELYLIAALDDDAVGATNTSIARIELKLPPGANLQDVRVEAAGLIEDLATELDNQLFLPLIAR